MQNGSKTKTKRTPEQIIADQEADTAARRVRLALRRSEALRSVVTARNVLSQVAEQMPEDIYGISEAAALADAEAVLVRFQDKLVQRVLAQGSNP